ncbi:MAG: hypothetical protein HY765_00200 [Rhodomicrobium sp.]|nr:hypothetical protein [Rhodomicrobium sp.]
MDLTLDPLSRGFLILTGCFVGLSFGLFGRARGLATAPALFIVLPLCGVPASGSLE